MRPVSLGLPIVTFSDSMTPLTVSNGSRTGVSHRLIDVPFRLASPKSSETIGSDARCSKNRDEKGAKKTEERNGYHSHCFTPDTCRAQESLHKAVQQSALSAVPRAVQADV